MKRNNLKKIFILNSYWCKFNFVFTTIIGIIMGGTVICSIILKQNFIDGVVFSYSNKGGLRNPIYALIFLAIVFIFQHIIDIPIYLINSKMNIALKKEFNGAILDKISKLNYELAEDNKIQDLIKRIENPSERIIKVFEQYRMLLKVIIQVVGIIIIIVKINLIVVLGIIVFIIAGILMNYRIGSVTYGFWQKYMENARLFNYISGIMINKDYVLEKKLFGYTDYMNNKFREEFEKAQSKNMALGRKKLKSQVFIEMYNIIYTIFCFIILLPLLLNSKITIGLYFSITVAVAELFNLLNDQLDKIIDFKEYIRYLDELEVFFQLEEREGCNNIGGKVSELYKVVFEDVYFTYQNQTKPILSGVSFVLEKGTHYALVGENGAGKSTIIKLLLGLYKPQKGKIYINDKNINEMNQDEVNSFFCSFSRLL